MWNPSKSVVLSSVCTKLMIAAVILFAFTAPMLVQKYLEYTGKDPAIIHSLLLTLYACFFPALTALLALDRLLANIKKEDIFIHKNVNHLRVISWCCFAVAAISAISGFYYILFLVIAVAAAFFGLIVRVVKNVIEKAVYIKAENDFTI